MLKKEHIKKFIIGLVIIVSTILLIDFSYANTYSNNSIEIEVSPEKRHYDYGENVVLNVNVKNKNRYGKLYYKIVDVYSGGGFNAINLNKNEKVINSFESSEEKVELKDKYYKKVKKGKSGRHAYGLTEKEYDEFIKYRNEKVVGEKIGSEEKEHFDKEVIEKTKSQINATFLIIIIVILIIVILIIFIWFIIKSKSSGGYGFKSIILFLSVSLLLSIINNNYKTYADDIYEENIKYEKTIQTQVNYANFTCTFDVKIEYYFVNTIAPITDLELDTDNDTLSDYLEVLYLTDLNNEDTDGDGLPDGVEVHRTYTDPLRVDTDNNGIKDSDEDYDNDGLSNIEEKNYGTDYDNVDTDFDNLSDYDEINGVESKDGKTYQTDPLREDTDLDGLSDYVEIKLGLNPTKVKSYGDIIDNEKRIYQEMDKSKLPREINEMLIPVNFYGEVKGDIDENVNVKISNNSFYNQIRGVVGEPIIIETIYGKGDGLKAKFDISKYLSIKERLQVCRYENGNLMPVEETYISGTNLLSDVYNGEYVMIDIDILLQSVNIYK